MKNITIFANCQGEAIVKFLKIGLPQNEWQIEYFSNNAKAGKMKAARVIIEGIKKSDILIYQPLGENHGELSDQAIKQIVREGASCVSFPYIFNSGTYSMDRNPHHPKSSYGIVYGEEYLIPLLKSINYSRVIELYQNGLINFDLNNRFQVCIDELKRRELRTHIKLAEFILMHYKNYKLFVTHNHPTTIIFLEICSQIKKLLNVPFSDSSIDKTQENWANLPLGEVPISPYDVEVHGYRFTYDKDWFSKGAKLISLIANHVYAEKIKDVIARLDNLIHAAQYHEAHELLTRALTEYPESKDLLVIKGELLYHAGAIDAAEKIFADIIRSCPTHTQALNGLACVKIIKRNFREATNLLQRVLHFDPQCLAAKENLKFLQTEVAKLQ